MEWLSTKVMGLVLGLLISLVTTFYWYDKKNRDHRLEKLEDRMTAAEDDHSKVLTELALVKSDVVHGNEMVQLQLHQVSAAIEELKELIREK